jgi:hypothetical protein
MLDSGLGVSLLAGEQLLSVMFLNLPINTLWNVGELGDGWGGSASWHRIPGEVSPAAGAPASDKAS